MSPPETSRYKQTLVVEIRVQHAGRMKSSRKQTGSDEDPPDGGVGHETQILDHFSDDRRLRHRTSGIGSSQRPRSGRRSWNDAGSRCRPQGGGAPRVRYRRGDHPHWTATSPAAICPTRTRHGPGQGSRRPGYRVHVARVRVWVARVRVPVARVRVHVAKEWVPAGVQVNAPPGWVPAGVQVNAPPGWVPVGAQVPADRVRARTRVKANNRQA